MRKHVMGKREAAQRDTAQKLAWPDLAWLDLEALAQVEVSSEAEGYPIEDALLDGQSSGWRAGVVGEATIHLRFDTPQAVGHVLLAFEETEHERAQEWALTALFANGTRREVLRQGWNFSPGGSAQSREQREVYRVDLKDVVEMLLWIDPDRGRDRYPATLERWQLA